MENILVEQQNILKKKAARLSVFSNTLLVLTKLMIGLITGAVSIVSEAAHSAVDLLAALIAFYAVRTAGKPPDSDHAYGHGKYENLSATIEAFLIIIAAIWIVFEALQKLYSPEPPAHLEFGLAVMILSIIVNYFVSAHLYKVAHETGSFALEADALHLRADIWTSVGVLVGLAIIYVTGWHIVDPLIAVFVALIIFKEGYFMTQKSLKQLTDISLPDEEEEKIRNIVRQHEEVIAFHQLRTRRSGSRRLIDMHIILDKTMSLEKCHAVCDSIEEELKSSFGLCDILIHTEPCDYHEGFGQCPLPRIQQKDE